MQHIQLNFDSFDHLKLLIFDVEQTNKNCQKLLQDIKLREKHFLLGNKLKNTFFPRKLCPDINFWSSKPHISIISQNIFV